MNLRSSLCLVVLSACAVVACSVSVRAQDALPDIPAKALWTQAPPLLETEDVGPPSLQSWVTLAEIFRKPDTGEWVQMIVKKDRRDSREFVVTTLNLATGKAKEHDVIKGYGQSKTAWTQGKFYFTTWLPGGLYVYDPIKDAIEQLDAPFKNPGVGAYRMSVSPDGVLAMGAGGTTGVSSYDPATNTVTRYGRPGGRGHAWVYYLASDNDYIYAALRGKAPWELVAINKKTKERETLMTVPPEGFMKIKRTGGIVWTNFSKREGERQIHFVDGKVVDGPPEPRQGPTPEPVARPRVLLDDSPLYEGKTCVAIHYQDPADMTQWKVAHVEAPLAAEGMLALTALDDGRIAAVGGPYNPIVLFDPKTGEGRQAPFAHVSARWLVAVGTTVYGTGYPSTTLVKWDTDRPCSNRIELPGKPAVSDSDPKANPRLVALWAQGPRNGGHMGVRMFVGADGCIYICAARHRHNLGYDVVWYDPAADKQGEIEDDGRNDHLACSWACLADGGKRMVVATTIEHNKQLDTPVPEDARLLRIDLINRKYVDEFVPFKGAKELTGVVEVAPDVIVGLAVGPQRKTTYVYRCNLAQRKVERVVRYAGVFLGVHGVQALPAKGLDFVMGPDGKIWTGADVDTETAAVLRIDPDDLTVEVAGRIRRRQMRYAFVDGAVYINGARNVRRIPALGALLTGR